MKNFVVFIIVSFATIENIGNRLNAQPVDVNDSLALVDLYNSTNGQKWDNNTNWLTTSPVRTWYGITVTNNRITRIDLGYNNLLGNLPSSIGNLKMLLRLSLNSNQLDGAIPASIGNLINLQWLFLASNTLSGNLPS